jgi:hypothetical protein
MRWGAQLSASPVKVVVERVDQRQVQMYGGDFAKYPSSYVVCSLLRRYGLKKVLDVTYGEGRFYYLCKSELEIVGADPVKWQWVVKPRLFLQENVFELHTALEHGLVKPQQPDVVVIDPPKWNPLVLYRRRSMYNYIIGTPRLIIEYGSRVAAILKAPYLLLHYRGVVPLKSYEPIHIVEFTFIARYLNTKNNNKSLYIVYTLTN